MGAEKAVNDTIFATLLHLPGITIVHIDIYEQGDCLIKAESTEKGTPCRWCGRTIHTPYGHGRELKIRHCSSDSAFDLDRPIDRFYTAAPNLFS